MKRSFFVSIIATLIFSIVLLNDNPKVEAKSVKEYEAEINDLDKKKNQVENKKSQLTKDKKSVKGKKNKNTNKQEIVNKELKDINEQLSTTKNDINTKETEIKDTKNEITNLSEEIETLIEEIADLEERMLKREILMKDRLRSIQEAGGDVTYVSVILGSQNFRDLITRSSAVNSIMDQDKSIIEEHERDQIALSKKQQEVEEKKETLEVKHKEQKEQKDSLLSLKSKLEKQNKEKAKIKKKLKKEYSELEAAELSLEEEQALMTSEAKYIKKAKRLAENNKVQLEKEIAAQEKAEQERIAREKAEQEKAEQERIAQETAEHETADQGKTEQEKSVQGTTDQGTAKQEKAAQPKSSVKAKTSTPTSGSSAASSNNQVQTGSTSNSGFIRPVNGSLTSPFGPRTHPITGEVGRMHYGQDFGAPTGTPIVAPKGGIVSYAGWMGGYGNTVMISHGNVTTLFAHMNSISVSAGQEVNQGQSIGTVGNTGNSTGPHLHFETHVGGYQGSGSAVNPTNYIQ